ncbi:hypothetical protein B0H14DRAFT_2629009 [Mycena olivaceomarginata]|nr:hypothetical protein B0H14DRAFT_2629009 [Mycena olivaceomarginata]
MLEYNKTPVRLRTSLRRPHPGPATPDTWRMIAGVVADLSRQAMWAPRFWRLEEIRSASEKRISDRESLSRGGKREEEEVEFSRKSEADVQIGTSDLFSSPPLFRDAVQAPMLSSQDALNRAVYEVEEPCRLLTGWKSRYVVQVVRKIALTSTESNKAVTMEKTEGREKGNGPTREGTPDVQSSGASLLVTGFKRKTSAAPQLPSLQHLPVQALAQRAMLMECALSRMSMSATLKKQEKPGMRVHKVVRLLKFDQPHIDGNYELGTCSHFGIRRVQRASGSGDLSGGATVAAVLIICGAMLEGLWLVPLVQGKEQATAPRQKSSIPLGKIEEVSKLGNYIDKDLSKVGVQREAATRKDDVCREENMLGDVVYSDQIQSIVVLSIPELDPRGSGQEGTTFRIRPLCKARGALTTGETLYTCRGGGSSVIEW